MSCRRWALPSTSWRRISITHSDDREAAELLASYRALYQKGMALLQEQSGPLFAMDGVVDGAYEWLRGPWPWEYPAAGKNASGSKKEG